MQNMNPVQGPVPQGPFTGGAGLPAAPPFVRTDQANTWAAFVQTMVTLVVTGVTTLFNVTITGLLNILNLTGTGTFTWTGVVIDPSFGGTITFPDGTSSINAGGARLVNGNEVRLQRGGNILAVDNTGVHDIGNTPFTWMGEMGGFSEKIISTPQSANANPFTIVDTNSKLVVNDIGGGALTIKLPAVSQSGRIFHIVNGQATTITLDGNGNTIDGAATKVLAAGPGGISVVFDRGLQWLTF